MAMAWQSAHVAVGVSALHSGAFVEVNEAFCRLFRFERSELLGQTSAQLGLWPDPAQRQRLLDLLQRQGSVRRFEARYRNRQGEVGEVEISARLVSQQGEAYLVGFFTEVTDRREFIEGLRAAQARLDLVLRSSGLLVFRQDSALRYTWVANPALGASESELIGRTDEEILGPEGAAPLVAIKQRVLRSGCPERRDVWVANKGQAGCFDLVVEPERDAAGRVVAIVCAAQDITQRMLAGPAIRGMPAQAIQGLASLLGREALSERQAERLGRIRYEAARWRAASERDQPALAQLQARHAGALAVVAEQNPVLRQLLQALLEQAGLRVAVAATGVEAFSLTLRLLPALLLIDMALPQAGGVAAVRALRSLLPRPLPILALLASDAPVQPGQALDADLDDVLDAPVPAELLYRKVLAWLDVRA